MNATVSDPSEEGSTRLLFKVISALDLGIGRQTVRNKCMQGINKLRWSGMRREKEGIKKKLSTIDNKPQNLVEDLDFHKYSVYKKMSTSWIHVVLTEDFQQVVICSWLR